MDRKKQDGEQTARQEIGSHLEMMTPRARSTFEPGFLGYAVSEVQAVVRFSISANIG